MNVQIAVLEIERNLQSFTLNRRKQRGVDVEIDRVAKLVRLARRGCFDASRKINRVVTPGGAFAETAEQVSECLVAQKIQTLFRHFETHIARQRFGDFAWTRRAALTIATLRLWLLFVQREITFFDEALDQLVQQLLA